MDQIEELLFAFRSARPTGPYRQAYPDKIGAIKALEHSNDKRVLQFFLSVIADTNEYDLARIETLKILGLRDYVPEDHATVGRAIMHLLDDRDDGVRNYATITMREFMQVDGALEAISKVLLDPDENITIRSSALGSLHRLGPDDRTIGTLNALLSDDEFRPDAIRTLNEWQVL